MNPPTYARVVREGEEVLEWLQDRLWMRRALGKARFLSRRHDYRAIVVSSPPHTTQLVGRGLRRHRDVPYVADFRDPWFFAIGRTRELKSRFWRWIARREEDVATEAATVVVYNTDRARDVVSRQLGIESKAVAIPNGYDYRGPVDAPDGSCFRIAYTGWFHPFMDVPELFSAVARFRQRHALPSESFRFHVMGAAPEFGGVELASLAASFGIADCFEFRGRGTPDEARALQQRASVLAAFDHPHPLAVPMKFYSYAAMSGTMLLLGHQEGAMADAAEKLGITVHDPTDEDAIDHTVNAAYSRWKSGDLSEPMDPDRIFARERQSARMGALLSKMGSPDAGNFRRSM